MAKVKDKKKLKTRHYFFLNPYEDCAFTRCPKCNNKTKIRKFPLVIHIEPGQLFLLNKICRYCVGCDLIIVKQSKLESLMAMRLENVRPDVIGNEYVTMGVAERKDWREGRDGKINTNEIVNRMYMFKDMLNFELIPAGWYRSDEK